MDDLRDDAAGRAVADRTRTRRRRLGAAAVGAAVLGSLVLVLDRGVAPAPGRQPDEPVEARSVDLDQPVRGSLAGDTTFLESVRRLPWTSPGAAPGPVDANEAGEPPVGSRRVVFAADVPGGRWALVVGPNVYRDPELTSGSTGSTDALSAAWFTGPADAEPGDMRLHSAPQSIGRRFPTALLDPRSGVLAVVTAPGDVVEVSDSREVDADGTVVRSFEPVETRDGVAVVDLDVPPLPYNVAVQYRVVRNGSPGQPTDPTSVIPDPLPETPPVRVRYPRGRPDAAGVDAAERTALTSLAYLGLPAEDTVLTAQWVGAMAGNEAGRAAIVTLPLPSGALLVQAGWFFRTADGATATGGCFSETRPAGPPAGERVYAAACIVADQRLVPVENFLVVAAPPTVATVRVYSTDGNFLVAHGTTDGVVVVPLLPTAAAVQGVTADGVQLGRSPLIGTVPLADRIAD